MTGLNVEELKVTQQKLKDEGFDPGVIDGLWGRNTSRAVRAFQSTQHLDPTGILDEPTMKALGLQKKMKAFEVDPPWLALARQKMGFLENEERTKAFLKADGKTLGDPSQFPWCGDFIETCFGLTLRDEILPVNPYYALNWLKWGQGLTEPALGCVGVKKRFQNKVLVGGHVFFVVGQTQLNIFALGGNQSNRVSIVTISKNVVEGYRWPSTQPLPPPMGISPPGSFARGGSEA
jgi:uncharacterized protein (TIGR02594 family)